MENETESRMEESGLTIGEVCRIVLKRIWYVLGASVLATVAAVLLFVFAINPRKVTYSGDFQVTYPLSETQKYPNGAPFFYHDIISSESLKKAVASSEELAGLDVDKLLKNEAVTFVAEIDSETKLYTGKYSISLKGSYFANYTQAIRFASAIADMYVTYINDSAQAVSYEVDATLFANLSYEMQLKSLADQKNKLLAEVDKWISEYHESYRVNGQTLKNIRAEIDGVYDDVTRNLLATELERCGYVPVGNIAKKKAQINAEIAYNERQMKALEEAMETMGSDNGSATPQSDIVTFATGDDTSGSASDDSSKWVINIQSVSDLLQKYATFITRNEQLNYQLEHLTEENIAPFAARIMTQYSRLSEKALMLADVTAQIYADNSRVFAGQEELRRDGGTNVLFVGVAVFVIVFLLASLVVFCIDAPKYRKKKLETAEVPADGETPKQEENKE